MNDELSEQLHRLWDAVLDEPIPADMQALLDKLGEIEWTR